MEIVDPGEAHGAPITAGKGTELDRAHRRSETSSLQACSDLGVEHLELCRCRRQIGRHRHGEGPSRGIEAGDAALQRTVAGDGRGYRNERQPGNPNGDGRDRRQQPAAPRPSTAQGAINRDRDAPHAALVASGSGTSEQLKHGQSTGVIEQLKHSR
jgi:hypothetical protein